MKIACHYCLSNAELVSGDVIYPHRKDLYSKLFYLCSPCKAYVGCHAGGDKPLGILANESLRKAKSKAHSYLDPIWRNGYMKRKEVYKWLANELQIDVDDCHIGMMDEDMCALAADVCRDKLSEFRNEFLTSISY